MATGTGRRFRRAKLKILLVVIASNLVCVHLFSGASLSVHIPASAPRIHLWDSAAPLRGLNATRAALAGARAELAAVRAQCNASSYLLESEELARYMTYNVGGECPEDDALALQVALKGCEPLPRRCCRPREPARYAEPVVRRSVPPDATVRWALYTCRNYSCLVKRARARGGPYFCKDCFDLEGKERRRWQADNGVLDMVRSMNVLSDWVHRARRRARVDALRHLLPAQHNLRGYVPIFDRVGFRRLRWKAGRKLDLGAERNEWYVSALLEKPMT
ncbi:S-adenosyl-L-methionine-dependent methyltransferase superfamily protein [Zea mays]|uniref:S-adenosyl-L-methionine-dependent methyltransferase superfamily protein n=1 Tax=Zea mays TaxID=4577 RepID=A0A1D6J7E2_MAIZE|nr:S-adenosyl-L-methionine-dependent methyltransferase superfamily protein [Zea mays]